VSFALCSVVALGSRVATERAVTLGSMVAIASVILLPAYAADVDWKMYGGTAVQGYEICFYDAKGAVRMPDGLVRVWTKCPPRLEMESIDIEHDFGGKILENTAQKLVQGYVPPIIAIGSIAFAEIAGITAYEETANITSIKPHATIFYELDCSQKMLRELSISFSVNGQYGSSQTPSVWKFIPPEGNAASLLKILCSSRSLRTMPSILYSNEYFNALPEAGKKQVLSSGFERA
jgi:hypothetical protein